MSARIWVVALALVACTGNETTDTDADDTDTETPDGPPGGYTFDSRFSVGSSVSYSGQTFRHLLIHDLDAYLGELTLEIDTGFFPAPGEIVDALEFYFEFDSSTSGGVPHDYSSQPAPVQITYADVSSDRNLVEKIAGNDPEGQHADWSTAFVGWTQPGVTTPESLVRTWFAEIETIATDRANGDVATGPDGEPMESVVVSPDGLHRAELLQKFLWGAIAFSQGADDYLDDDLPGSGLLAANATAEEGEPYSALEHAWDEGFGWFGAARDYGAWSDELLDGDAYADTYDPDGAIDLLSEVSWGHARYAGKRDLGAVVPTDFSGDAFAAFLDGRALIASTDGELDSTALDELRAHRDAAVAAWEKAIAASVVHYANETLADMTKFGSDDYEFVEHAEHWSELKGFALSFQFNPRSTIDDSSLVDLHALIGMGPALPTDPQGTIDAYHDDLIAARTMIGDAFGFADENLGDDDGAGGW